MTTTDNNGRLGNQIIRNIAVSIIAQKYNLKVTYSSKDIIDNLGIGLFSGTKIYNTTHDLNDSNYIFIYNSNHVKYNLNPNNSYFQTKEIMNGIYNYLRLDEIKPHIIEKNIFKNRYYKNKDLFIHIRLTDVAHLNPGINYYLNTINKINFDNIYLSSDDINHSIIKSIKENYPNATIINYNEIQTIQFASTCKHIILSHGSFSAIIGYLAYCSNVYYPEYELNKMWYGDMFTINHWNKIKTLE